MQIDRERLAEAMCNDLACRVLAQQTESPSFDHSATSVREYWRIMAATVLTDIAEQGFALVERDPLFSRRAAVMRAISDPGSVTDRKGSKSGPETERHWQARAAWAAMIDAGKEEG